MSANNDPVVSGESDPVLVSFKLQYGKSCTELSLPVSATINDIKEKAHSLHSIPPAMQKLLIKGQIKPDTSTLQEAGIKKGLRLMLIGSKYAFSQTLRQTALRL